MLGLELLRPAGGRWHDGSDEPRDCARWEILRWVARVARAGSGVTRVRGSGSRRAGLSGQSPGQVRVVARRPERGIERSGWTQ